jgi:hypothetical protein
MFTGNYWAPDPYSRTPRFDPPWEISNTGWGSNETDESWPEFQLCPDVVLVHHKDLTSHVYHYIILTPQRPDCV